MTTAFTQTDYITLEDMLGANTYRPLNLVIDYGEGVWVTDVEGKTYLDCLSAYSSSNFGHCHPKLVETMQNQCKKLTQTSRAFRNKELPLLFQELTQLTGKNRILPMNTGVEAVETAVKLARKWGYTRKNIPQNQAEIIVCENNFHGRTVTAISFSSEQAYKNNFGPFTPGFKIVPYGNIEAFKNAITENTCGFLVEPIQGEGGVIIPPQGYLKEVEILCKQNNVLLIADEIQTGLGRTGKLFACEHENVVPDVLIMGKSLSGGMYPVSAVLADNSIMDVFVPGDHGSTFSGNPLGSAVSRTAIKLLLEEKLIKNSEIMGEMLLQGLKTVNNSHIKEIRGRGLFIAVELDEPARPYCDKLMQNGILCKETRSSIIRITPPLIINGEQINIIIDCIKKVFGN